MAAAIRRIDRWTALLAAIGALGTVLVLLRTATFGADVGGDAAGFVSTAHSLLAGGGFVMHYGDPYYREAPPGLPLALAFAGLFGPDPLDAAGYLHAAAFGLTVLVAAAWVRSRTGSPLLAVWAGLACALSPSLGGLFSTAMTEPLFICFTTLSLYALDRCLAVDGRRSLLLAAAVCAALACATRYIGFALVASAVPVLLLAERRGFRPTVQGIANAALFAAVALAPAGAWMLRNVLTFGSPLGGIRPTGFSPLADLHAAAGEIARWTLGESGFATLGSWSEALPGVAAGEPSIAAALVRLAAPLALLAVAAAALAPPRADSRSRAGLALPAAFLACYALALAFVLVRRDASLYPRYLAPLYPPLLAAASIALAEALRRASRRGPRVRLPRRLGGAGATLPALALASALALWLPQQALATYDDVRDWRANGRGYTAAREWTESATIRWLKANPPDGRVWSNSVHAVYFAADLRTGNRKLPYVLHQAALRAAEARAEGADDLFVWFHRGFWQLYGPVDLAALPDLEVEAVLEDGVVLRPGGGSAARGAPLAESLLAGARLLAAFAASGFDLYLDEARNRLIYVRDGCAEVDPAEWSDPSGWFFLEAYPADPAALPADRRYAGLDFFFVRHGFRERGSCLAVRDLPGFEVAAVRTGQWVRGEGEAWSVRTSLAGIPARALDVDALRERAEPLAREPFEVYRDGGRLVYARESCAAADIETRFILEVVPADPADLSEHRRGHGFDDLDFWFRDGDYVFEDGGRCAAARELPAYPIASIRTGQWADGGAWSAGATLGATPYAAALDLDVLRARAEPLAREPFEVYRDGGRLVYVREDCAAADVEARFILHVWPADPADLPEERRERGFDDLDFWFREGDYGFEEGGRCVAARELPAYRIASIRTGQWADGGGEAWVVRATPGAAPPAAALDIGALRARAEPLAREPFEVYRDGGRLVYVRESCAAADVEARFVLEVVPADPADLPEHRRGHGFDDLDFWFRDGDYGFEEGGRCVAARELPAYPIALMSTGQWVREESEEWSVRATPGAAPPAAALDLGALRARAEPLAREPFEVYRDGGRLVYAREDCAAADVETRFILHVWPSDPADLPEERRERGFDDLDFWFREGDYGFEEGGRCVAARELPAYRIASVRTGQWADGGGEAWVVRATPGAALPAAALDLDALRDRAEPLARDPFEVYRDGGRLVYAREDCAAADIAPGFFVHVVPADPAELPEHRRGNGFDNLDFGFRDRDYGFEEGGRCVAARELPAYRIASIRTGQWVRGEGELWSVEAAFGE